MIRIALYIGDICCAPAEVVCSSTNPNLELIAGTRAALRMAGGHSIQEEYIVIIEREKAAQGRRWLPPGSAAKTGGIN